jgi:hypothetical protein
MGSTWILQKYIEFPLLLAGRKFDIRSFVLVTPNKQAWLHSESYIRTSSAIFTLENLSDRCYTLAPVRGLLRLEGETHGAAVQVHPSDQ